jgi:NAD(P)H-hydrate epimerase
MVVGGSGQFIGAPVLAAHAALKSGVGWVVSALPESVVQIVAGNLLESTWLPLRSSTGNISKDNVSQIIENMDGVSSLLIGPGLPDDPETHEFIRAIVNPKLQFPPLVLDAGALRALKKKDLELLPLDTILTPHPGEMAALTGLDVKAVQLDRVGIAKKFAQAWNCVVVLKGAFTVVASSSGRVGILPVATPALAKAGTGDVLAGIIVGVRAQGVPAFDAAVLAIWIHAKAALRAVGQVGGTAAVLPSTIIENIGWFLN